MFKHDERLWIFGYGSLLWRPGFSYDERAACFIRGFRRRFWQGSTDHRGVPGAPGRVVTLLPHEEAVCWGAAYAVNPANRDQVLAQLDHREKGGYARHFLEVRTHEEAEPFASALVYLATSENEAFLGCAPLPEIADRVVQSRGPSGENSEYVLKLDESLRELGATDSHVKRLATLVRARLGAAG